MKFILSTLFVLLLASVSFADGYILQSNGYYTYGTDPQLYYRSYETTPGYWRGGCYYAGVSRWVYYAYNAPKAAVLPTYDAPNAVDQLLKIKLAEIEQQTKIASFVNAAKALGMENRLVALPAYSVQGYGLSPTVSGHYYQNYATGAATQYAYNAVQYGSLDINALNLMQAQLTQSVQDAAREGFAKHTETVAAMNAGATKVAEINARTSFAVAMLNSLSTEPKLQSQGYKFQIDPANSALKLMPPLDADAKTWETEAVSFITQACASCHSGKNLKGGFDINTWFTMNQQQRDRLIMERITTPDLTKRMPRNADGSVGQPVTGKNLLLLRTPKF